MYIKTKLKNHGFTVVEFVLLLVLVLALAAITFFVIQRFNQKKSNHQPGTNNQNATNEVSWAFDDRSNRWFVKTGSAPACHEPFQFAYSPIEKAQIASVLLPGAYRGFSYKPHGGFGTVNNGLVAVRLPSDATLVGLTRYYEGNPADVQYMLTFETPCGIAFRFDHLHTLSPAFQQLAEQTPEPKINDTRTNPNDNPPRTKFKAGDVVATRVGMPKMQLYGFDFGVYDYRQPNEISKNSQWAAIHNQYESLDWFGVCWYGMLPGIEQSYLQQLSLQQTDTRRVVKKVSDYCAHAPYKTLDVNHGQPTDG